MSFGAIPTPTLPLRGEGRLAYKGLTFSEE
jgi:hypothetical protein